MVLKICTIILWCNIFQFSIIFISYNCTRRVFFYNSKYNFIFTFLIVLYYTFLFSPWRHYNPKVIKIKLFTWFNMNHNLHGSRWWIINQTQAAAEKISTNQSKYVCVHQGIMIDSCQKLRKSLQIYTESSLQNILTCLR